MIGGEARDRRTACRVLRRAARLLVCPTPQGPGTRRERRRAERAARLRATPSRALYWALAEGAPRGDADASLLVAELVHGAVREELAARHPGQPVAGGLIRLAAAHGAPALQEVFLAAADRLRPPEAGS